MLYKNFYKLSWYRIPPLLLVLAIVGILATVVAVIGIVRNKKSSDKTRLIIPIGICSVIALIGWLCVFNIVHGEATYVYPYYSGEYQTVTGVVRNYSESGNHRVSYEVEGIKFSNYTSAVAFGYFPTNGGIINKDGIRVEIKYIPNEQGDNAIVELNCVEEDVDLSRSNKINLDQVKHTLWGIAVVIALVICILRRRKEKTESMNI
ncbi:MAG: hypothetical protein ACI3XR_01325 [Eubacteriales bacterium]